MTESSSLRRLGNSGLAVSVVGLGTNNFGMKLDLEQCRAVVHAALDQGINLFDTSDSYGASEERSERFCRGNATMS
jgi:aryl-alcohol dehydrogenase-like predicted oxidoreductase